MTLPRFRVRTLMVAVAVAALLISGALMGAKSYRYYRLASFYRERERGWRRVAYRPAPDPAMDRFRREAAEYFAGLTAKYQYALWHPWLPVAPDPDAPGNREWREQEARKQQQ